MLDLTFCTLFAGPEPITIVTTVFRPRQKSPESVDPDYSQCVVAQWLNSPPPPYSLLMNCPLLLFCKSLWGAVSCGGRRQTSSHPNQFPVTHPHPSFTPTLHQQQIYHKHGSIFFSISPVITHHHTLISTPFPPQML